MPQQALAFLFETAFLHSSSKNKNVVVYTCLHVEAQVDLFSDPRLQSTVATVLASFPGSCAVNAQEPGNKAATTSDHQSIKTLALQ